VGWDLFIRDSPAAELERARPRLLLSFIGVVPPLVAEKLLVSLIVLLFLAGCWRLGGAYALLAMPLTFHLLMQMGFYNYSLGVVLSLHAIMS
jgi:hypothetical protein